MTNLLSNQKLVRNGEKFEIDFNRFVFHFVGDTQLVTDCKAVADIAVLVDSSASLRNEFHKEVKFVKSLADQLRISKDGVRMGVVTFSYYAELTIKLSDHTNPESFKRAANKIPLMKSQTYIDRGLIVTRKELFTEENGDRKDVPNVVILLTDGVQTISRYSVPAETIADALRRDGVTVLGIGIGSEVDPKELQRIVGDSENLYLSSDFNQLISDDFISKLVAKACKVSKGETDNLFLACK